VIYVYTKTKEAKGMEIFYTVTMQTKAGKKLYLSMWDGHPKWTFDFDEACYWDTEEMAENFSREWFKNFTGWAVEEIKIDINKVK
jgi:hypothetical protein